MDDERKLAGMQEARYEHVPPDIYGIGELPPITVVRVVVPDSLRLLASDLIRREWDKRQRRRVSPLRRPVESNGMEWNRELAYARWKEAGDIGTDEEGVKEEEFEGDVDNIEAEDGEYDGYDSI